MSYWDKLYDTIQQAFLTLVEQLITYSPKVIGAILIIIIGYFIAKGVGWIVKKFSQKLGLDRLLKKTLPDQLTEGTLAPSVIMGKITFWIIILAILLAAFDSLGITAVRDSLNNLVAYIPNLIIAIVILVGGLFVAQFARGSVLAALEKMAFQFAGQIASTVYVFIVFITIVMVAKQVSIDVSALQNFVVGFVFCIMVYGGAVLAWGAKGPIENIIAGHHIRKVFEPGTEIKIQDQQGTIVSIQNIHTVLEVGDEEIHVPNTVFISNITKSKTSK